MYLSSKQIIAKRTAKELQDGDVVNLGIGIPGMVADYLPGDIDIIFHAENGLVGILGTQGAVDPDITNAGGQLIVPAIGAASIDSAMSFALIRGGHIDVTVLGALQVDKHANLANYMVPGKIVPGMGGAMDLVVGAKKVIVAMEHNAKDGSAKILNQCTLPLTAVNVVNMIITELAVFTLSNEGLTLTEYAPGVTLEVIKEKTQADFIVSDYLKEMYL